MSLTHSSDAGRAVVPVPSRSVKRRKRAHVARIVVGFPLHADRPEQVHEFAPGTNLAEALMTISPDRWGGLTFELYRGAITAEGYVRQELAADETLEAGDLWYVPVYPSEPISATAIISSLAIYMGGSTLAYVAATVIVYVAMAAISMAISFAVTMLLAPGKQADKAGAAADQPSSLNSLSPPRNSMRPLSRVPDIYGKMRHWPDLLFPAVARWDPVFTTNPPEGRENTKDTSSQYVQAVYCIGRGLYELEQFRFGDSGIETANGTVRVYPPGTTLPADVKMSYSVSNLQRQELGEVNSANMWTPWYDIPAESVDEIWVQLNWPSGIIYGISGKKVYPPNTWADMNVLIRIEAERLDENGAVVETATWDNAINRQTRNELRITYRQACTPGRWRVRVADVFPTDRTWKGVTFTPYKKCYVEGITGFQTLTDDQRTFEHETVVIVDANNRTSPAAQNLDKFNVLATRVLQTQEDGAPPGVLSAPRADRRWITAAINTLLDPFICNYQASEIDWPSLVEVQTALEAYVDPFDESEFNGIFDRQMSADEQLQLVTRKARAQVFMSSGRVTFARDQRRTGVAALFNRRNRLAERGSLGLGLRLPGPDDYDGVEITFFDEADEYRQSTYTYPEGITPLNPLSIDLVGATKRHEVCRRARFEWAAQRYRRRTQPLRVTEEAQLLLPYDRVAVVAPWDEGVIDGELLEVTGTTVRLDRPLPLNVPNTARIRLRASDGRQTSLHSFTTRPDLGPEWLDLATAPAFTMVVPGSDKQLGTLYNLSRADNYDAATHWLVTGAEIDDRGVTLSLMEDADEVYQLSDDLLDPCMDFTPCVAVEIPLDFGYDPESDGTTHFLQTPTNDSGSIWFEDNGIGDQIYARGPVSDRATWTPNVAHATVATPAGLTITLTRSNPASAFSGGGVLLYSAPAPQAFPACEEHVSASWSFDVNVTITGTCTTASVVLGGTSLVLDDAPQDVAVDDLIQATGWSVDLPKYRFSWNGTTLTRYETDETGNEVGSPITPTNGFTYYEGGFLSSGLIAIECGLFWGGIGTAQATIVITNARYGCECAE